MTDLQRAPWSEWETVRLIGRGSFGTVYEIRRTLIDGTIETAAMKVVSIPQNQSDVDEMYSDGYNRESVIATVNSHLRSIVTEYSLMKKMDGCANIVNCDDVRYVQHTDGIGWDVFIRMELLTPILKAIPGETTPDEAIRVGEDICTALVLCSKHGIVHRDIKPQNIFLSIYGDYKLGDFGIAKTIERTMGGTRVGTYKYMAPEVFNNQPYGSNADIYSLGLVLYWLLNERRMPFLPLPPAKMTTAMDDNARDRRLNGEPLPPPANGSAELKRIVLKACAFRPEDRYQFAGEMLDDLRRIGRGYVPQKSGIEPKAVLTDPVEDEAEPGTGTVGLEFIKKEKKRMPVESTPAQQPAVTPRVVPTPTPTPAPTPAPAPKKEKKPGKKTGLIVAVVLVLAAAGIAAALWAMGVFSHTHHWDEGVVKAEPGVTKDGVMVYTCSGCGEEREEEIPATGMIYDDVAEGSWYYDAIVWAADNGLTKGAKDSSFYPDQSCDRALLVSFLWNAIGSPRPKTDNPFVDVRKSDYFYNAVRWAFESGIVSGVDESHFGPYVDCNRAQAITFLYRTMGSPAVHSASPFDDVREGDFFYEAVIWAYETGISSGVSTTKFDPFGTCSRAQVATLLYRAFTK